MIKWMVTLASVGLGCGGSAPMIQEGPSVVAQGEQLVLEKNCARCHDAGDQLLSGSAAPLGKRGFFGPNLTADKETGLGDWTPQQIARALMEGVDNQERQLCQVMPRFTDFTPDQALAIAAYLQTLTPVSRPDIPDPACPEAR